VFIFYVDEVLILLILLENIILGRDHNVGDSIYYYTEIFSKVTCLLIGIVGSSKSILLFLLIGFIIFF